jgi:signal transduction histidine kinase
MPPSLRPEAILRQATSLSWTVDAMKDVEGKRELVVKSQRAANEHLMVSISDTGVSLPPQQADQIFNAFFTTKSYGTGMGLRISRSIIESHGGMG